MKKDSFCYRYTGLLLPRHYFLVSFRRLTKKPADTVLSVLSLSVAIVCFSLCLYYFYSLFRGMSVFPTYGRLVEIHEKGSEYVYRNIGHDDLQRYGNGIFEALAGYEPVGLKAETDGDNYFFSALRCNADFFKVFPPEVIDGSLDDFGRRPGTAVLTEWAVNRYGGVSALKPGGMFLSEGRWYEVVAVIADYPAGSCPFAYCDVFVPYQDVITGSLTGLLKTPADTAALARRLVDVRPAGGPPVTLEPVLLSDKPYEWGADLVLAVIGLLVLLTASINFFTAGTKKLLMRQQEIRLRTVLGQERAGAPHWLLFTEQATTLLLTLLVALTLTETVVVKLFEYLPPEVRRQLEPDYGALFRFEVIVVCLLLVFSWFFSRLLAVMVMRRLRRSGLSVVHPHERSWVNNAILSLQMTFGVLFLSALLASVYICRQEADRVNGNLTEKEMKEIVMLNFSSSEWSKEPEKEVVLQRLAGSPWLETWATLSTVLLPGSLRAEYYVSPGFFDIMKQPVQPVEGEPFAYLCPAKNVSGDMEKTVEVNGKQLAVTGRLALREFVYKQDFDILCLPEAAAPAGMRPEYLMLKVRAGSDLKQVRHDLERILGDARFVGQPFRLETFYDMAVEADMASLVQFVFGGSALICLLISLLGIYRAIMSDTAFRQKEVALHKIHGATYRDIWWLIGKPYIGIYAASCCIGLLLNFILYGFFSEIMFLHSYSYDVRIIIWTVLCTAIVILLTIGWRINRIARVNPAGLIRKE